LLGQPSPQVVPPGIQGSPPEEEGRAKLEKEMAKKANQERHADLKRDTDKLLKLATELKEYVDKSNENVLSLNVLKKAEQIEKLNFYRDGRWPGIPKFPNPGAIRLLVVRVDLDYER